MVKIRRGRGAEAAQTNSETVMNIYDRRAQRAETVLDICDRRAQRAETVMNIYDRGAKQTVSS